MIACVSVSIFPCEARPDSSQAKPHSSKSCAQYTHAVPFEYAREPYTQMKACDSVRPPRLSLLPRAHNNAAIIRGYALAVAKRIPPALAAGPQIPHLSKT